MSVNQILIDKALELKPQDKYILMELLAQSLDKPDSSLDSLWINEAMERLNAHKNGKTTGVPVEEVIGESL